MEKAALICTQLTVLIFKRAIDRYLFILRLGLRRLITAAEYDIVNLTTQKAALCSYPPQLGSLAGASDIDIFVAANCAALPKAR